MDQKPKKPRKNKKVKLILNEKEKWKKILRKVESSDLVPYDMMGGININLNDGSTIMIDIKQLMDDGFSASDLEDEINGKLFEFDEAIESVDFLLSIDMVAQRVQPATDMILRDL